MSQTATEWFIRGTADEKGRIVRVNLWPFPFKVGRTPGVNLRLISKRVSSEHAQFFLRDGVLFVQDMESTNGTFVNGDRVDLKALGEGDILHFADQQFLVEHSQHQVMSIDTMRFNATELGPMPQPIKHTRELVELLRTRAVRVEFQPLVRLADGVAVAYEALGRGDLGSVPTSPWQLLGTAEQLGLAAELSALFRERQLLEASQLPATASGGRPILFVNTHPAEMDRWETLLDSLRAFRRLDPTLPVVLEIHESAVTDIATFRILRQQLDELNVQQAFDDFGTGQARLQELCEVSPDYVKFDIGFARDLHLVSEKRREMVRSLVRMMEDMKIFTVVEGVENAEEAAACRDLGFDFGQGYHFGRPLPVDQLPATTD